MKILIAEDEPVMLALIAAHLTDHGFHVILACDGQEAIEQFNATQPDLVITDLMMPLTSGLELITIIKSGHRAETPVIVLSALDQESMVQQAFNLGACDFISKPFEVSELAARVRRFV